MRRARCARRVRGDALTVEVRALTQADAPVAVDLTNAEGWAFDEADIARLLTVGGGVVAEEAHRVLGLLTLVHYSALSWIGNVVVRPGARGRGVGAALVDGALAAARAHGATTVGLYSVLPAISLYARAGFRPAGETVSFHGRAASGSSPGPGVVPFPDTRVRTVARFDAPLFGDDRSRLLAALVRAYPDTSFLFERARKVAGFVIAKPGAKGAEIGPLVTRTDDTEAIAALLDAALGSLPAGSVEVGTRAENATAIAALRARGFEEQFRARTMWWGATGHEGDARAQAAVGGLEKG
ncbi:MAG: GNAT family N-acetyltransferase [Thermoplasmatota archaeon]